MKSTKIWKYIRGISVACFCLLIAVQSSAQALPHSGAPDVQQITCETGVQGPCSDCPCEDEQGERECDSACSCCSSFAALSESVIFNSSSIVAIFSPAEPLLLMPQVYFPIFVPPENCSWT